MFYFSNQFCTNSLISQNCSNLCLSYLQCILYCFIMPSTPNISSQSSVETTIRRTLPWKSVVYTVNDIVHRQIIIDNTFHRRSRRGSSLKGTLNLFNMYLDTIFLSCFVTKTDQQCHICSVDGSLSLLLDHISIKQ